MPRYDRRYRAEADFSSLTAERRARIAAMRGDLDRAERWMKFAQMIEAAGMRQNQRLDAFRAQYKRETHDEESYDEYLRKLGYLGTPPWRASPPDIK